MENATKKGEQKHEKAGPKVRLRWEKLLFKKPVYRATFQNGVYLIAQFDDFKSSWSGGVSGQYVRRDFATKEEAQLYCESVLTGMLLRDLGTLLGENWSDRPGKTRSRIVTSIPTTTTTITHITIITARRASIIITITTMTTTTTPRPGAMRMLRSRRNSPVPAAGGAACRRSSR